MMRQTTLPVFIAALLSGGVAAAQAPAGTTPQSSASSQSSPSDQPRAATKEQGHSRSAKTDPQSHPSSQAAATQTRPDASYPHPSGQDSQPDNSSHQTRVASAKSKSDHGTVENRGAKTADQSRPVQKLSERKTYSGNSGSKADPGTACSTARRTQDGGIDCGTSGNSATEGKVVTKPH